MKGRRPRPHPQPAIYGWTTAFLLVGFFALALTRNFVPVVGWHKFCLILTVAVVVVAVVLGRLYSGGKEFADVGTARAILLIVLLIVVGGGSFYMFIARLAPQVAAVVAGENVRIEAIVYKLPENLLRVCNLSSNVALVGVPELTEQELIRMRLAGIYATDEYMGVEISGGSYLTPKDFCFDNRDRARLPDGRFAAFLHGKQTRVGFLIQGLEYKKE